MAHDSTITFDGSRVFVKEANSVLFFVQRGDSLVRCYVTYKALAAYFGATSGQHGQDTCLQAYDAHRDTIHGIAQRVLAQREHDAGCLVVITSSDVYQDMVDACLMRPAGMHAPLAPAGHA